MTALKSKANIVDDEETLSLYFDGSKSWEGAGVGCVLTDPKDNITFIAC